NYRKEYIESLGIFADKPRHDENSDGADAFQTFGLYIEGADLRSQRDAMARKERVPSSPVPVNELDQPHEVGAQSQRKGTMRAYT
ncbi:MAG: hypothetical protein KAG66_19290, partial [Methylococcales bacterium]|nr:hypothetical protein [Methylococcales bacterium]